MSGHILPRHRKMVEQAVLDVEKNKISALKHVQSQPLKPCRFCGGPAEWCLGERGDGSPWDYIACADCEAVGPYAPGTGNRAHDAEQWRTLWNQPPVQATANAGSTGDIGWWLSAALDDPAVCDEMKVAINKWFASGQPAPQLLAQVLDALVWAENALAPFSKSPAEKSGISKLRAAISEAQDAIANFTVSREEALVAALEPFANLKLPNLKNQGNAGAYSLLYADIRRAKVVISNSERGNG